MAIDLYTGMEDELPANDETEAWDACDRCGSSHCDGFCGDEAFEDDGAEFEESGDGLTDAEADAMTLRDCGWGTDEDYGYYGGDEDF